MIKNILNDIVNTVIPENTYKPSIQIGNFCFLIAGIELLLSCKYFVHFIYFYPQNANKYIELEKNAKSINISEICILCQNYYVKNSDLNILYNKIQNIMLTELGEESRGQEDMNIVFLYFEKNILYFILFTKFQYVTFNRGQEPSQIDIYSKKALYSIYTLINNFAHLTCVETLNKLKEYDFICGVVFLISNHYEVYAFKQKKIYVMNTNYLLDFTWKTLTIFCESYNEGNLNIFKLLHSDKLIL